LRFRGDKFDALSDSKFVHLNSLATKRRFAFAGGTAFKASVSGLDLSADLGRIGRTAALAIRTVRSFQLKVDIGLKI
jgi:hypothetical protein